MRRQLVEVGILLIMTAFLLGGCMLFGDKSISPLQANSLRHIEVVVSGGLTDSIAADLEAYGRITKRLDKISGVAMDVRESALGGLSSLPYIKALGDRAERHALDYSSGISTWNMDMINITDYDGRVVEYDGKGVYVAVLDTGLVKNWSDYLPADQVATQYAKAFAGGASVNSHVAEPTNLWERDTDSHGTHVTSSILGFNMFGTQINGAAPGVMVIPVKVLGNNGSGWSTVIAEGITYIANLKNNLSVPIPMVINMSLGGPFLSPLEKAAIDYAIGKGVIIVAAAGNSGDAGMDYPGAYEPVISVGSAGWISEWSSGGWWQADVADPTDAGDVYVSNFSAREKPGQDLDVLAPGSWIVGPYLAYGAAHPPIWANGIPGEYYYLGGTSMATPHVAGLVALMLQKDPKLLPAHAEGILERTALWIGAGDALVNGEEISWGSDATGSGLVQADKALRRTH